MAVTEHAPIDGPARERIPEPPPFDARQLERPTGKRWISEFLLAYPQPVLALLRYFFPAVHVPFTRWHVALRYDEVQEVLSHNREFPVAWGERMKGLTEGESFVLGMADNAKYRNRYELLAHAFPLEDIAEHVERAAADFANAIVQSHKGAPFDAVQDLVSTVPAQLCESYFGIAAPDKVAFVQWTLAISSYTFGPSTDKGHKKLAMAGAANLSAAIRGSLRSARSHGTRAKAMERLLALQAADPSIDEDVLHAQLFGMVLGFIPTDVLGGGNMLETLLRRPDFLERARTAALANDDELLWRCLREALRFRHINLGPWRICPHGYKLGEGGPREHRIAPGSYVLASTQSAMFDPRRIERPHVFDPYRREEDYMVFGVGQHWCLGAYIAKAQITQTLKPLLQCKGLKAVAPGKPSVKRFNDLFPLHLQVQVTA